MRILNQTVVTSLSALVGGVIAAAPAQAAGLPQLDFTTYSSQLVWLALTFVVLYVLLSRVALPRIGEVLEERQNKIDDNLAKAEELKAQAEDASNAYDKSLSDARANAFAAIRAVKDKAAVEAAKRQGALNEKLQAQIASSEQAITQARDEALSGITGVATDVASAVVEKLIGDAPSDASVDGAIQAALKNRA